MVSISIKRKQVFQSTVKKYSIKRVLELVDKNLDMYLVQVNATKCDASMRMLIEGWDKDKATKELILSPDGRVK